MKKVFTLMAILLMLPTASFATDIFAEQTGKNCEYCHAGTPSELEFTPAGNAFIENYYELPMWGLVTQHLIKKFHRFLISLHAVSSFAFAGGLLFLGFTAPQLIEKRNPKAVEKKFFIWSITLAGTSALLLLPMIIQQDGFLESQTGFIIVVKAILFLLMAVSTLYQYLFLAKKAESARDNKPEEFKNAVNNWGMISQINIILAIAIIAVTALSNI